MSNHGASGSPTNIEPVEPRRMELSINDTDGSLRTASLFQVLLAATGSLHQDISDMVIGELDVKITQGEDEEETTMSKKERMSNMSFAQRRHELSWRLSSNGKSIQQLAALTAAAASTDLGDIVDVSTRALQHTRTAWVQADEAQDNLYFFHAELFPKRAPPHDIYGAADLLIDRSWYDLPRDLLLMTDRYQMSQESQYSRQETDERWQLVMRQKLITGEVGKLRTCNMPSPWKIILKDGVVKLTYGEPKESRFPVEGFLTVLPSPEESTWTLLSLNVTVSAKTGEFNHQLEISNRQRYDLHRISSLAMQKEEQSSDDPKPLQSLFSVAHTFLLSWQLELLSAQAQSLRRGVWAATTGQPISVSPVNFHSSYGIVYLSFWKVDDSYGTPRIEDLQDAESNRTFDCPHRQQLTLAIRAEFGDAMRVSLSGANRMRDETEMIDRLLQAASDPLALSASDALWAATKLCSYYRCQAVYDALKDALPNFLRLTVEKGSIAVASRIRYYGLHESERYPVLFRMMCDLRTGTFVTTFPRSFNLMRALACNDSQASEPMSLRMANLPPNRRRVLGATSSGRIVRDAFDSLIRSINLLGQRCGVGGTWEDMDFQSSKLRERSIAGACSDVQAALTKCCGMVVLYGLASTSLSVAVGLDGIPDMAGFSMESVEGIELLRAPPISILMNQELIETSTVKSDGVNIKSSHIDQSLFSIGCALSSDGIMLVPLDVSVKLESPAASPEEISATLLKFENKADTCRSVIMNGSSHDDRPSKRSKHENGVGSIETEDANIEVSRLAALLASLLEPND